MNSRILIAATAAILLAGCSGGNAPKEESKAPPKEEKAPDAYKVRFDTSKGIVVIEVTRDWAPRGADRFYELVKSGFYDGDRFFRVRPNFVVQFGINGDPKIEQLWREMRIPDDPVKESNRKGTITFATAGPVTRTTQVFINLVDNQRLDGQGFSPFGKVVEGMDIVESFYSGYGEMAPRGSGPDPNQIEMQGNQYLEAHFPRLDYIKKAVIAQ